MEIEGTVGFTTEEEYHDDGKITLKFSLNIENQQDLWIICLSPLHFVFVGLLTTEYCRQCFELKERIGVILKSIVTLRTDKEVTICS